MTAPLPLLPPEVDLTDFEYMPLLVRRLRDSDLVSDHSPEECWAALLLWAASWHQVPAASIPDNQQWQAKHAGYVSRGRIDPIWQKVKAGALHNYVLCADGRLYHQVVAEIAAESWNKKLEVEHKRACERVRKENIDRKERREPELPKPPKPEPLTAHDVDGIKVWRQRKPDAIPLDRATTSAGNDESVPHQPHAGSPPSAGFPAENVLKRSEEKLKEVEGKGSFYPRSVGVTPTDTEPAKDSQGDGKNIEKSKARPNGAGQNWSSMAYVQATAITVDRPRRQGESDEDWTDAVRSEVEKRMRQAESEANRRRKA